MIEMWLRDLIMFANVAAAGGAGVVVGLLVVLIIRRLLPGPWWL